MTETTNRPRPNWSVRSDRNLHITIAAMWVGFAIFAGTVVLVTAKLILPTAWMPL